MKPNNPVPSPASEAELHACVDHQLTPEREREILALLESRPEEAQRVEAYRRQNHDLHALFDPVLGEPVPGRLLQAATRRSRRSMQRLAASVAIAMVSGAAGWGLHGAVAPGRDDGRSPVAVDGFVQRAAIAHAVFSPEKRRPVEVGADQEDQLVAWLSKRMDAPIKPPHLQALGYALEGGRLLPGGKGPVAQFMFHDGRGARLTLYVSREVADVAPGGRTGVNQDTSFRFSQQGTVNVFYWVDGPFGYALSADADKAELARVSAEVYRQLARRG